MHVQHGASVVVTDGRKALFLSNEGDAEFPNLRLLQRREHASLADRELKSAAPGRAFGSHDHGSRRSSYAETDFHEQAETEFALEIAEFLNDRVQIHGLDELVIVAPPRTLGVLRKHLGREALAQVTAEIPKDLVKHPIAEIERLLGAYPEPA